MKETEIYKTIPLKESEGGTLNFAIIEEPYGEGSKAVISICASLGEGKESWKVHIPFSQIKEVRQALKEARKARKKQKTAKKPKDKEAKKSKEAKAKETSAPKKEAKTAKKQPQ